MEVRGRKYGGQTSPERTKVWVEPHSKSHAQMQQRKKVPVVYYLCRNRHLEHPHFMEVTLSSSDGLYLRDVVNRLNAFRGKGMAALYSWSCKRSYKNGFVWHDLSEDDLVLPAHGNEYILKGSELLDQSAQGQLDTISAITKKECPKIPQIHSPKSGGTHEGSFSSSPPPDKKDKKMLVRDDDQSHMDTAPSTPQSFSSASSPSTTEYRVIKPVEAQDASTQTEERRNQVLTAPLPVSLPVSVPGQVRSKKLSPEIVRDPPSPASNPTYPSTSSPLTSSATGTTGRIDTLESLIRAEASRRNSFKVVEEEEIFSPEDGRLKPSNLLLHIVTCGSLSVKDHKGFGIVPTYRPRFTQIGFPSPVISTLRDLDRLSESTRAVGLRVEDSEHYSGNLIEMKKHKEDLTAGPGVKRSTSFENERSYNKSTPNWKRDNKHVNGSTTPKCLPQTIKMIPSKQLRGENVKSPVGKLSPLSSSNGASKRAMTDSSSVAGSTSMRVDSFKADKEKIIKIEERLASGARVVIQSTAICDDSDGSCDSL